ncbi:putative Pancreatic lipase-related protein 2 [Hypsibius exemplaris]|uniref:Pancreatic lipase-related protein 2 n=1 Tax=Hypsibius exemplaris TaxID=2072580 RepID=A0A9X6RLY7_HYPEX|nr:putative Pancreatic lipase-related protein 2 [Hypsibius exemplaris]
MGPSVVALTLLLALLQAVCPITASPHGPRTISLGDRVEPESTAYIYTSIAQSYLQYEAAKRAAEVGLNRDVNDDHICYNGYGCFYKNGTFGNFYRLPAGPDHVRTNFHLYTSAEQRDPEVLDYKDVASLGESSFRGDRPTVMMIHGFGSGPWSAWSPRLKAAVFRGQPEVNYIFVDWNKGAKAPDYWGASANTQMVAVQIAKLIAGLNTQKGSRSSSFHLIGHSLGAHAAGFTAHRLNVLGHERVGKITALDPAGPIFEGGHSDALLSIGDADFVAGVHGNAVSLFLGGFGLYTRVGDIDFYPNGGQHQPGCQHIVTGVISSILQFDWGSVPESAKCNHNRAIEFAIESVDSTCAGTHVSYACDSFDDFKDGKCFGGETGDMGLFATSRASAKPHYLVTKGDDTGFCAHAMKVSLRLSPESEESKGSIFVTLVGRDGVEESIEQMTDGESLPSGKVLVEVVASRTKVSDLQAVKIRYEPSCNWVWWGCWADRITADWVEIDSLESDGHGDHQCGGFQILYKGDTPSESGPNCGLSSFHSCATIWNRDEKFCTVSNLNEAQAENENESGSNQATGNPDNPTTSTSTQLTTAAPNKTGAQQYVSNKKRKLEGGEAAEMDNLIGKFADNLCQPREKTSTSSAFAHYVLSALNDLSLLKRLDDRAEIMAPLNRLQSLKVKVMTAEEYDNRIGDMEFFL